ncbi:MULTISPECIES: APC family permease [unclassified Microbacterium]|uniref:APC family permease n=1 Tax=unclassified Microbacterium TaxID=2609290 RepID=UPI00386F1423
MTTPSLGRHLGLGAAVAIGLGSMIGAGVFSALGPATAAAGSGVFVALAVAAVVAFGNATSTAQLAAVHPTSGGVYAYGRAELGPWWGFAAGWGFVVGKIASCAAMALTFSAYVAPNGWERVVAAAAVVALTAVNLVGITRTAQVTRLLVAVVLLVLAAASVAIFTGDRTPSAALAAGIPVDAYGVLQAAGLLFFAFAGYARIATLGEEVRDPATTIPRAIILAFAGAVLVYAVVAVAVTAALGTDGVAASTAPVADAVRAADAAWALPLVQVGAAAASLGALLALIAGIGRTAFAMAREGDLPGILNAVHPRWGVPHRAEIAAGGAIVLLVLTVDLRGAIGFSSFGVLVYYAVANLAAYRQRRSARRYPRILQIVGLSGCLILGATLPWQAVAAGAAVIAVGLGARVVRLSSRPWTR